MEDDIIKGIQKLEIILPSAIPDWQNYRKYKSRWEGFESSNSSTTTNTESKEDVKQSKEEKDKGLVNPTGQDIRNDSGGLGHFGAPRGVDSNGKKRLHEGLDFSTIVGQNIVAPFSGKVRNLKGNTYPHYPMVQLYPIPSTPRFDRLEILYVEKPEEIQEDVFRAIKSGETIGTASDLQRWYSPKIGSHVHVQLFKNDVRIDPKPFFFKAE